MILGDTLNATGPMTGETDLPAVRATLDDLFRRAAVARPDAFALVDPTDRTSFTDGPVRRLTYAQADRAIAEAKSRALHEWRDESARADEYAAEILAAEGWAHRLYRRAARKPAPAMVGRKRAEPILTAWRKPSSISGERNTFPDDATKRTLDDAIASMPVTGP